MNPAEAKIRQVRPKLYTVAPLTALICWGYAVINLGMGLGLLFLYTTPVPIAIANILSYPAWGVLFFGLGMVGCGALWRNNWALTKNVQLLGLLVKTIWGIALIIRCLVVPQTILITLVWIFFAYIQAVVYIHFLPNNPGEENAK